MIANRNFNYFDPHCHINGILNKLGLNPNYPFDKLSSQWPAHFDGCVTVQEESQPQFDLLFRTQKHKNLHFAVGIHPLFSYQYSAEYEDKLINYYLQDRRVKAIGEIGLDRYKGNSTMEHQKTIFIKQIEISNRFSIPFVIHTRQADDDTYEILNNFVPRDKVFHIHCFSGSLAFCDKVLSEWKNAYFGITGKILYKNPNVSQHIKDIVKRIPINRILAETDSPFLMPPHLNQPCSTPALIPSIIREIASLKNLSERDTFVQIRENSRVVYKA